MAVWFWYLVKSNLSCVHESQINSEKKFSRTPRVIINAPLKITTYLMKFAKTGPLELIVKFRKVADFLLRARARNNFVKLFLRLPTLENYIKPIYSFKWEWHFKLNSFLNLIIYFINGLKCFFCLFFLSLATLDATNLTLSRGISPYSQNLQ